MFPGECEILSVDHIGPGPPSFPNASSALYAGFYYLETLDLNQRPIYRHTRRDAVLLFKKANFGGHNNDRWEFSGCVKL